MSHTSNQNSFTNVPKPIFKTFWLWGTRFLNPAKSAKIDLSAKMALDPPDSYFSTPPDLDPPDSSSENSII